MNFRPSAQGFFGGWIACLLLLAGHSQAARLGIASFNVAWAGTPQDFAQHIAVCNHPSVAWCNSRNKQPERAQACQAAFEQAAGGRQAALLMAPCNAYRLGSAHMTSDTSALYAEKMAGLKATVHQLITVHQVDVLAFQEVKSVETIALMLGEHAKAFDMCVAPHNAFQTVGFAWRRSISLQAGRCTPEPKLAIADNPRDTTSLKRLRPGLTLNLYINNKPLALLNVHLKSACANLHNSPKFEGRILTAPDEPCQSLNRQLPPLEAWIERVSAQTPHFVVLGDFNRRLDEEEQAQLRPDQVRSDHSAPHSPLRPDPQGRVNTRYMWPELADGSPALVRVKLTEAPGPACMGFMGLDHIVLSGPLAAMQNPPAKAIKVPVVQKAGQAIPTSDHCPQTTAIRF